MSTESGRAGQDDRPSREVAYRLFAAEFDDASFSYSESDEERAPNYVVTPTGARVNRLFAVGVLTEVQSVNDDVLRGRVVDPTGAFVSYAGQYQPDEMAFFDRASPPAFVALAGKARTFQPDDSDRVFTSVRPESVSRVDADTRDRWTVSAAEATLERIGVMAAAIQSGLTGSTLRDALFEAGVDESLATGVPLALDHYGTTPAYLAALRRLAVEALEVVAGDRDSVDSLDSSPGEAGAPDASLDAFAADLALPSRTEATVESETAETTETTETADTVAAETAAEVDTSTSTEADADQTTAVADTEEVSTVDETAAPAADETTVDTAEDAPPETVANSTQSDELGDFDAGGPAATESTETTETTETTGDADADGMYELDEEEREEVEAEFGTEFSTGSEVAPAGEADIDVPSAEEIEGELDADFGAEDGTETAAGETTAGEASGERDADEESTERTAEDVDLEAAAVDAMAALDDGDGATRDGVVAHVVDEYGVDPGAVEDAIQRALMSGQCYEPTEDSLKAI